MLTRAEASVSIGRSRYSNCNFAIVNVLTGTVVIKLVYFCRRPPLLTIEPERQNVAQGTVAVIRCIATDDPSARITWRKVTDTLPTYAQVRTS